MTEPVIGSIVDIPVGRGLVRFYGPTSFSAGKWVGVELSGPVGKNDGTVQGVKYFTCKPNHGMFLRPSQVKVISESSRPASTATKPALGHKKAPSITRTSSARSTETTSRSASPLKTTSSINPPPSPGPGRTATASRPPLMSPNKRQTFTTLSKSSLSRQSTLADGPLSPSPVVPARKLPLLQSKRPSSPLSQPPESSTASSSPVTETAPVQKGVRPRPSSSLTSELLTTSSPSPEPSTPPPVVAPPAPVQDDAELQELRARVRVLEAKRADEARHVRELENRLNEAESFVALRPKLQAKLTSLQSDLTATKRELADAKQLSALGDNRTVDLQDQMEMAMLDKEMAEERAEVAETELEEVKEKLAVIQVELEVLKNGGGGPEDSEKESGVKSSMAYIQLEKQNERLKEALMRLRDASQDNDQEQRRRIADMEKDVANLEELQNSHESVLIMLQNAEQQVEDLKLQLDDALGAEEMLVQLTERNLMLSEKIEEMRVTIEDLEALQELNDELEENHVETERALHEELESKDTHIRELDAKAESLEESCQDLENTIVRFRELVMQLQTELDTLRAETQTAYEKSASAATQTAAMLSLNLRLQSTASKNHAKQIELEVKTIEAREIKELLTIIQPYLPDVYTESDNDATSCYMFFQRLAAKTDLINTVVAQTHGLPDSLNGSVSDMLVGICEMRGRLSSLSTLCKRFASILRRCDVDSFLNIGRLYQEISPMEKRIDMHIDLLRREEFREMECVSDIVKIHAQFDHIGETYFAGFDFDLGERELGYALSFDHDLDMFAASLGLVKTSIEAAMKEDDVILDVGGLNPAETLYVPLKRVLDQCRSGKNPSRKLMKRIEDLLKDSSALKAHLVSNLQDLNNSFSELINFGISLAQQIMPYLSDVRGSKTPFQFERVLSLVRQTASNTVNKGSNASSPWQGVSDYIANVLQQANALVPLTMEAGNTVKITGTPPWVTRVSEVKARAAVNVEAERRVVQLNDEIQALVRNVKSKDQNIQESSVKIELMERRMETVKKQADTINDLEAELGKARRQERSYEEAIDQLQHDLDTLEQDNMKLKALANNPERQASAAQPAETETLQVEGNVETCYLLEQIEAYRGTVRFLRMENSYLKGQDLLHEIRALPELRAPSSLSRTPTPPLEPSGLSDTDEEDDGSDSEGSPKMRSKPPPTLRSLATETKLLYRDVIRFSASPRVVDLSATSANRSRSKQLEDGSVVAVGRGWVPRKKMPAHQVWERKVEGDRLNRRVKGLMERASSLSKNL